MAACCLVQRRHDPLKALAKFVNLLFMPNSIFICNEGESTDEAKIVCPAKERVLRVSKGKCDLLAKCCGFPNSILRNFRIRIFLSIEVITRPINQVINPCDTRSCCRANRRWSRRLQITEVALVASPSLLGDHLDLVVWHEHQ